ncbi:hypothetical protein CAG64_11095 [Vibrio sp. V38_P2S17PM301]|uniref:hypothetical protein n=1 Tax=Vibrio sp. V38_P2S17PM301 TaxID=1938689 RepID=UPI00136187B9|nr:hypothetical protein [Vibrio sp. V38_P2S17PM301]NAX25992.1 hypothetical protein [Vibrio sp. V38_P2S17PM301]
MDKKLFHLYGALVCLFTIPLGFYLCIEDIYDVYYLNGETIKVSYYFAVAPLLLYISLIFVFLGGIFASRQESQPLSKAKKIHFFPLSGYICCHICNVGDYVQAINSR